MYAEATMEELAIIAALNPTHPDSIPVIGHIPADQWAHAILIAEMHATWPHEPVITDNEKYYNYETGFSLPARVIRLASRQGDEVLFQEYIEKYGTHLKEEEVEILWGIYNYFGAQKGDFEYARELFLKIKA